MKKIAVEYRSTDSIIPYSNNPRCNGDAIPAIAESIKKYGFTQPVVVDREGVIVVGHTRFFAAQLLGMKEIPCVVADDLSDEQARAYRIADNRLGELATWNERFLYEELVASGDELTGFSEEEIGNIFDKFEKEDTEVKDAARDDRAKPKSDGIELVFDIAFTTRDDKDRFDQFYSTFNGDNMAMIQFIKERVSSVQ